MISPLSVQRDFPVRICHTPSVLRLFLRGAWNRSDMCACAFNWILCEDQIVRRFLSFSPFHYSSPNVYLWVPVGPYVYLVYSVYLVYLVYPVCTYVYPVYLVYSVYLVYLIYPVYLVPYPKSFVLFCAKHHEYTAAPGHINKIPLEYRLSLAKTRLYILILVSRTKYPVRGYTLI